MKRELLLRFLISEVPVCHDEGGSTCFDGEQPRLEVTKEHLFVHNQLQQKLRLLG